MPKKKQKTQPKTYPKTKPKPKQKAEVKPVNITSSKYYWIMLTVMMVVFGSVYGYFMKASFAAIVILLASVVSVIGFAYYLKFKPSSLAVTRRATFLFVGASIIGFCIWAATVLMLYEAGFYPQINDAMGITYFAITSMVICLVGGAFIGDWIGTKKSSLLNP